MRAASQLLFILFYLCSSYVTSQHRILYIVHKVEHSNSRSDEPSFERCNERVRYTHFREAKKAGVDFGFVPDASPKFFHVVTTQEFRPQIVLLRSQFDVETSHSRAPPQA
jgi:hypothetical protein